MTPEGKVKKAAKNILDSLHGCWYFSPQSGVYGRSGIPDLVGCYKGKFFSIECKAAGNTTTALQEKEIAAIRSAGGLSLVIDESNIDRLKPILIMLGA